jgi:hypothetical protein
MEYTKIFFLLRSFINIDAGSKKIGIQKTCGYFSFVIVGITF